MPAIGGPDVGTADDTTGTALGLDAGELAGELAVDELADGVPAEHAATDRPAAQVADSKSLQNRVADEACVEKERPHDHAQFELGKSFGQE